MDAETLRATQAPLKQRYRDDPSSAATPLHSRGAFSDAGITCTIETWAGAVRAGLHPATGGDGGDACSGDMLLGALAACAGVTLRSVATALGVAVRTARVAADGTFDARGTLGVSRDVPVGITNISLRFALDTDADDATLERLASLTERYCVVAQSLREPPRIVVERTATEAASG